MQKTLARQQIAVMSAGQKVFHQTGVLRFANVIQQGRDQEYLARLSRAK